MNHVHEVSWLPVWCCGRGCGCCDAAAAVCAAVAAVCDIGIHKH